MLCFPIYLDLVALYQGDFLFEPVFFNYFQMKWGVSFIHLFCLDNQQGIHLYINISQFINVLSAVLITC